jgi:CheY-like chemotaxis protein
VRSYYVNTTLPADQLGEVERGIDAHDLAESFCACEHQGLVAVLGKDALPFSSLKDAENAQRRLQALLPELFQNAAVAFSESASDFMEDANSNDEEFIDLDALIASQTDTTITEGKYAVVACRDDSERRLIMHLFETMKMYVVGANSAQDALVLLEEQPVDVLVMDVRFDDMHGWAMLGKLREMGHSEQTRVIALADVGTGSDQVFALTVAKVDIYLRKPISMARLRQSVWSLLKEHAAG